MDKGKGRATPEAVAPLNGQSGMSELRQQLLDKTNVRPHSLDSDVLFLPRNCRGLAFVPPSYLSSHGYQCKEKSSTSLAVP